MGLLGYLLLPRNGKHIEIESGMLLDASFVPHAAMMGVMKDNRLLKRGSIECSWPFCINTLILTKLIATDGINPSNYTRLLR